MNHIFGAEKIASAPHPDLSLFKFKDSDAILPKFRAMYLLNISNLFPK